MSFAPGPVENRAVSAILVVGLLAIFLGFASQIFVPPAPAAPSASSIPFPFHSTNSTAPGNGTGSPGNGSSGTGSGSGTGTGSGGGSGGTGGGGNSSGSGGTGGTGGGNSSGHGNGTGSGNGTKNGTGGSGGGGSGGSGGSGGNGSSATGGNNGSTNQSQPHSANGSSKTPIPPNKPPPPRTFLRLPILVWAGILAVAAVATAILLLSRTRWGSARLRSVTRRILRSAPEPDPRANPTVGAAGSVSGGGTVATAMPTGPRERIVRGYATFLDQVRPRLESDLGPLTPLEIESGARGLWANAGAALGEIRALFEEARYSPHPISDTHCARFTAVLGELLPRSTMRGLAA